MILKSNGFFFEFILFMLNQSFSFPSPEIQLCPLLSGSPFQFHCVLFSFPVLLALLWDDFSEKVIFHEKWTPRLASKKVQGFFLFKLPFFYVIFLPGFHVGIPWAAYILFCRLDFQEACFWLSSAVWMENKAGCFPVFLGFFFFFCKGFP